MDISRIFPAFRKLLLSGAFVVAAFPVTILAQFAPIGFVKKTVAIGLVNSSSAAGPTAATTNAFTITSTTAGNTLIVAVAGGAGCNVASVTDNVSNTYTASGALISTTSGYGDMVDVWYAKNIKAGATTVTLHFSSCNQSTNTWTFEVSGLSRTAPLDAFANVTKKVTQPYSAPTVATSANNVEFVISVVQTDLGESSIYSGPFTNLTQENGNMAAYDVTTTTGSYGAVWNTDGTITSSTWSASASVAFKP